MASNDPWRLLCCCSVIPSASCAFMMSSGEMNASASGSAARTGRLKLKTATQSAAVERRYFIVGVMVGLLAMQWLFLIVKKVGLSRRLGPREQEGGRRMPVGHEE